MRRSQCGSNLLPHILHTFERLKMIEWERLTLAGVDMVAKDIALQNPRPDHGEDIRKRLFTVSQN